MVDAGELETRLYPFEYFDLVRRRWVRARYKASIEAIGRMHGPFRITGAPEIRMRGDLYGYSLGHVARGPGEKG